MNESVVIKVFDSISSLKYSECDKRLLLVPKCQKVKHQSGLRLSVQQPYLVFN